jgi:UDP-2,3-diacylglucosamine pyrophosphatase LpxH
MGHRHKAVIHTIGKGCYVNLGEWFRQPHYGVYDGDNFELVEYGVLDS